MDALRAQLTGLVAGSLAVSVLLAASGCAEGRAEQATPEPAQISAPGDSLLPMEQMLARFRSGLPPATQLVGGTHSREELVGRFVSAVESGDTAALRALEISRSEWAYLYFPSSRYAAPPFELPPDVAWVLSRAASDKGRSRVVRRLGGQRLQYRGHVCADSATEGTNRFWRGCTVGYEHPDEGPVRRRLFGAIIEKHGHYKFLSYSNDF